MQLIIDENGVVVSETELYSGGSGVVSRANVDIALSKDELNDDDVKLLFSYLKATRNINQYSQVKVNGKWIDDSVMDVILQDHTAFGYVHKVLRLAHEYSMLLKKNRQTNINTWYDLFDTIGCTDKRMQSRVKAALLNSKLLAILRTEYNGTTEKVFIVNPFIYRRSAFVSQIALYAFSSDVKNYVDGYTYSWLKAIGIV